MRWSLKPPKKEHARQKTIYPFKKKDLKSTESSYFFIEPCIIIMCIIYPYIYISYIFLYSWKFRVNIFSSQHGKQGLFLKKKLGWLHHRGYNMLQLPTHPSRSHFVSEKNIKLDVFIKAQKMVIHPFCEGIIYELSSAEKSTHTHTTWSIKF